MRIYHLNCGTMAPFGGRLISGAGRMLSPARLICHCLLIETGDGLVLVDTGFGQAAVSQPAKVLGNRFLWLTRPRLDPAETAVRHIERLGYTAQDVRHIVLTHLDIDHASGLADFPDARVHVHTDELAAARHPRTALERDRYRSAIWAHGPRWVTHAAGGERWFGFESVREIPGLPSDITLIPLSGHTRGHVGVAVETSGTDSGTDSGKAAGTGTTAHETAGADAAGNRRWLLHAGDAYFFRGQMDAARPHCPTGLRAFQSMVQTVKSDRVHNVERLRELAARGDVEVFSAHDPVELAQATGGRGAARDDQEDPVAGA